MKNKKFWRLENSVEGSGTGAKLYIDGPISEESWWGDEATPQQLREELKLVTGKSLEVVLNSPGGDVWAGVAMHDALKELDAEVTIKVSGLAASIASVIAMAGDKIVITPGSTMMIHKASMLAWGNSDDMQKAIEMLETVEDGIVSIYADRTGQSREQVASMMKAETWMSAEKAVELGFADSVVKPETDLEDADEAPANLFAGNVSISMRATQKALNSYASKVHDSEEATADDAPGEEADDSPTPEPTPAVPAEEPAPADDADTTEAAPTDKAQPKPVNKPVTESEPTNMNPEDSAAPQVLDPKDQPAVDAPVASKLRDYLKSNKSVEDFADVLAKNAGGKSEDVRAAWAAKVATIENNVTNPEVLLPEAVISAIEDAFAEGGEIWNRVNKTGLDVFRTAVDTEDGEESRAKGHTRGDDKAEEEITLADRVLRAQFIYKYLTLDKETVRENRSTGALLRYVLSELPKRVVRECERAIVSGDGRLDSSDYKITSFLSLREDANGDNDGGEVYASQYTPGVGESRYETVVRAKALVKAAGKKTMVAKSGFMTDLLLLQSVNGGYVFQPGTDLAGAMGFDAIIEPDWMDADPENDAYIFVGDAYKTVGDNTVEAFSNFLLKQNKNEYLQEIYAGGGLSARDSAVAITATDES